MEFNDDAYSTAVGWRNIVRGTQTKSTQEGARKFVNRYLGYEAVPEGGDIWGFLEEWHTGQLWHFIEDAGLGTITEAEEPNIKLATNTLDNFSYVPRASKKALSRAFEKALR